MITQNITLYCKKYSVPPVVHAVQNDTNREVAAFLGDLTLTGSMTAELSVFRSDGTHYDGTATINTGTNSVTAEIDQALTQAGKQRCQIKVTESDGTGSTFTFIVDAQPDTSGVSVEQDGWSVQEIMDDIEALETGKQDKLTAGDGITIEDDTISVDSDDTLTSETKPAQAAAVREALEAMDYSKAPVIVDTADGPIASFPDGADNYPMRSVVAYINPVQEGSGDPSPDNVRPITGWSSAKVTRTGKNLVSASEVVAGYIENAGTIHAQSSPSLEYTSGLICVDGYAKMTVGMNGIGNDESPWCGVGWYDENMNWLGRYTNTVAYHTFVTPQTAKYMKFSVRTYGHGIGNMYCAYGEDSDFVAQDSQTVTISLGDTRYGGTLDVTRGKLRVTHGYIKYKGSASESWGDYSSYNGFYITLYGMKVGTRQDGLSNMLKDSKSSEAGQTNTMWLGVNSAYLFVIGVYDSMGNTVESFKSYLSSHNLEVVYPLSTPIEVDLTPTEITTLLGTNNLWSDTGDIEVEYCADTKLYIDKVLSGGSVQTLGMVRPSTTPAVLTNMGDFEDDQIRGDQITAGTIRTAEIGEIQQEESNGDSILG